MVAPHGLTGEATPMVSQTSMAGWQLQWAISTTAQPRHWSSEFRLCRLPRARNSRDPGGSCWAYPGVDAELIPHVFHSIFGSLTSWGAMFDILSTPGWSRMVGIKEWDRNCRLRGHMGWWAIVTTIVGSSIVGLVKTEHYLNFYCRMTSATTNELAASYATANELPTTIYLQDYERHGLPLLGYHMLLLPLAIIASALERLHHFLHGFQRAELDYQRRSIIEPAIKPSINNHMLVGC